MDLYRFFHPHHNPRLRQKPLRLQEISELELAAKELLRALNRAVLRTQSTKSKVPLDFLDSAINATELSLEFLQSIVDFCDEDSEEELKELMKERINAPGWEAWCTLLSERLRSLKDRTSPVHLENKINHTEEHSIFQSEKEAYNETQENLLPSEIIKIKVTA
jgi:hypothetical protein